MFMYFLTLFNSQFKGTRSALAVTTPASTQTSFAGDAAGSSKYVVKAMILK